MTGRFGAFFIRQMTGEAPGSICNEGPGSEGEGSTLLEDVIELRGSHRIRREIVRIWPHGGRQLSVFYRHVYLGIPLGRGLMWEDAEIKNTMVQATQGLDRFGPQGCVISCVLLGGVYCLGCRWVVYALDCSTLPLEGSLPALI